MLHVQHKHRGRGLARTITSALAHKYFRDGLPVFVCIAKGNELSARLHEKWGFKEVGSAYWMAYYPANTDGGKTETDYKEIGH